MIALVASLALQVAFEDEAARAYAVKAQESLTSNVLITPPSLVHGVGWLKLGKVHAPVSLSPGCKTLVNRMGVGKVTEELWQAALGDRLSTANLRDLVILEREQNVANFWAVSKTTLKERYRRVALAWLLHNNREKLKSFQRYAVLARFEAEARGLRVPMGLIRAAKALRLDPSDGSTTIHVVASALAKPLATAEELRWAEEVTTQALKVPLRRLQLAAASHQGVELASPVERAVRSADRHPHRGSRAEGQKWGTGAWKPGKLDAQLRQIQQDLRSASQTRLQALTTAALAQAQKRKLTPLEAAKAALAIVEGGRRASMAWGSRISPPTGLLDELTWAMHEALPDSGSSREWVRARFLAESSASAVYRKLAPIARRLLQSGADPELDYAVLDELVVPFVPSPLSRAEIQAILDRLVKASPPGARFRAVAATYYAMYTHGKRREDLERSIHYRREWLRLAPPNATGRPVSQMLLEHELKLLRNLDRGGTPR